MAKKLIRSKNMTSAKSVVQIYTAFPTKKVATKISHQLLKEKLIACANIFPAGVSVYEWNNKVEETSEVVTILKTPAKNSQKTMERLLALHPYECPCILELRPIRGLKPYIQWVINSNAGSNSKP